MALKDTWVDKRDGIDINSASHINEVAAAVISLEEDNADKNNISLGIASDGLIYIFVDGTPVGTGIPQGQSGDVFGYVDENNTIVLNGNLADGTYTLKYEMDNGEIVNIGNMVLDSNVYYSITKNLTQCSINNNATQIVEGESYSATITANDGYELESVSVTMGGSAVSVSGGVINIASVTGNIVITAVAEEVVVSYRQCEYIANSDLSSYVDLGIVNTDTTGMQVTFEITNDTSSNQYPAYFGNTDIACGAASGATDLRAYIGGVKSYQLVATPAENTEYIVGVNYLNTKKATINGETKSMNSGTMSYAKSETLTLCKQNGNANYSKGGWTKIKEVYISEDSAVSKHYVPAYRSPDGAIGMLETNSNTFIVATGNFTKGADV